MNFIDTVMDKWHIFSAKIQPGLQKTTEVLDTAGENLLRAWKYVMKMRKVFMAVPVGVAAVWLAIYNMTHLPVVVGLNLQATGDFAIQIGREIAVLGPLAVTAVCLLLMFASRRTLTPWLVSVFSLSLPVLVLITNVFPA